MGVVATRDCLSNQHVSLPLLVAADHTQTLSEAKDHKKIIEKGVPEDVPPGVKHGNEPLPTQALSGMLNKYGNKVRLHFKKETDQLWIGTKGKSG